MTANSHNNVAIALDDAGKLADSLAEHRVALAIREKQLGHDHPQVAQSFGGIGSELHSMGDLEEALHAMNEAIAVDRRALPPKHVQLLAHLANRAQDLADLGRLDDAQIAYDEILPILRTGFGKSGRYVRALTRHAAEVLLRKGRANDALVEAEEAVALAAKISGDKPNDDDAVALWARGSILEALGKLDAALADHKRAIALYEKMFGPDPEDAMDPLTGIGHIELARGHTAAAVAALEHALAVCAKRSLHGLWLARSRFELARALVATDRNRAITLAKQARDWYATVPSLSAQLAAIDALLR
jgi:serine/threonine-protein kinase